MSRDLSPEALALEYVAHGLPILPLRPRNKEPYYDLLPLVDGEHSWRPLRAGVDPAEVHRWFDHDPALNIGIITGGDLAVADVDARDKLHGLGFPVTPTAKTGRALHAYFDNRAHRIRAGRYPWGDVKAEGGYVCAPPSVHENGNRYEWFPFLSIFDVPLAPPPDALLQTEARNTIISCFTSEGSAKGIHEELGAEWAVALAILTLCGADVRGPGKAFRCPLPGHDERRPSAALWKPEGGYYGLHDFHMRGAEEWYTLADCYAAHTTGTTRKLGKGEGAVWWLRALEDIGAITVATMPAPELSQDAPQSARKLYAGFVRLLSLRAVYDPTQATVAPFSWRFAQGWCSIGSPNTVKSGLAWLFKQGYLELTGETTKGTSLLGLCKDKRDKEGAQ
jgi:hypothetical protein